MRAGPSQEEIRRQNLGALLRFVHVRGSISRAELTSELGLNRSTIGALTADLAAVGLVSEEAPRETGRAGRPSLVVRPSSELVYSYAASVEVDRVRVARVGLGGVILDQREAPRPRGEAIEAVRPVAEFVAQMAETVKPQARCIGAGIAVCGLVRREDGLVRLGPHLGWLDEPLGHALQDRLPDLLPQVAVGNVADLCALAEHTRGVAVGCDNIIYMYGDVGVGAGIIAGGRRVTGHGGYGGEVGHMVVNPHGRPCGCGSRGCWETEIGEHALLHAAGRDTAQGSDAVLAVVDAAARGDATAQVAVRQVGDWLGFGVANLVNIFNPELVIFGGTLRDVYLAAAAQVRSRLNSIGLPATREHVRLRTPKLGGDAALLGAAELAFEQLLADPLG
ncbi:ROK family transcriptional regulator [Catellatospora citrea]|uniref:ROK family transcriptional regulator n=2 Tax=Catellatospora citrea TaxID=53366 RepID=UPI000E713353|nr:ROK family transcriptional regulator [Catellatospora citrea]RKE08240.1 putative NBD/HSP70 family sugar kinase [Catellatospora citrea]